MTLKYSDIRQYVYKNVSDEAIAVRFNTTVDAIRRIKGTSSTFIPHRVPTYRCPGCGLKMELKPCMECEMTKAKNLKPLKARMA